MNKLVNNIPNDLDARDQEILAEIFNRRVASRNVAKEAAAEAESSASKSAADQSTP